MTKIFVSSSKGGVGKSTLCFQFLAPYLFNRDKKKSILVDLDKTNSETKVFIKSELYDVKELSSKDLSSLPLLVNADENLIVDTGAAEGSLKALETIDNVSLIDNIDLFCIPISRGGQAEASALSMYASIKELREDAKICFVLSDYLDIDEIPLEVQFRRFLGNKTYRLSTKIENITGDFDRLKKEDPLVSWISIPQVPCLILASEFGFTAYEFSNKLEELDKKQKDLAKAVAKQADKNDEYLVTVRKTLIAKQCRRFKNRIFEEKFLKDLKEILGD